MVGKVSGENTPMHSIKRLEKGVVPVEVKGKEDASSVLDTIEISKEAQELEKTVANLKIELNKTPDVRHEKVEIARNRNQTGFYDTKEVIKETAKILLKEFEARSSDLS